MPPSTVVASALADDCGPEGHRNLCQLRRRPRGRRRRPRGRPRPARRPDRSERRGQDDLHRRDQRLRPVERPRRARRARPHRPGAARARAARPRSNVAVDRAVRRSQRAREPGRRVAPPVDARSTQGDARRLPGAGSATIDPTLELLELGSIADERCPASCRRGSASSSGSPARSSRNRGSSASTSRPPGSTPTRATSSGSDCAGSSTRASRCCSSTTTWVSCSAICDDVVVLDFGKVIAQGPPEEVRRQPAGDRGVPRAARPPERRGGER